MITIVKRVKRLGLVFTDFAWANSVNKFKRFNLIYGWNGSGKTTFTRLFDHIASQSDAELEFEIEDDAGAVFTSGSAFPFPIRVFNQDYVQNNVRILESSARSISVLLGEENKELAAQIDADERLLNGDPKDKTKIGLVREFEDFRQKKQRKERENDTSFTDIAKTIGAAIVGSGAASRTYRSPDARKDFQAVREVKLLTDDEREQHILALKQHMLPELDAVKSPIVFISGKDADLFKVLEAALINAERLCAATVESEIIDRLATNHDIAEWVEAGLDLHKKHASPSCEFCGNPLGSELFPRLARHFSEADRQLKTEIEAQLVELREVHRVLNTIEVPDGARLYTELQKPYSQAVAALGSARSILIAQVTAVGQALQGKKAVTTESVEFRLPMETEPLATVLAAVNSMLLKHNEKTKDFMATQRASVEAIKAHYLGTIFEDVTRKRREIDELEVDLAKRAEVIAAKRLRIADARAEISSAHAACEHINEGVKTFLGRAELTFVPNEAADGDEEAKVVGFRIMRGEKPAIYLSEGEKTALAFVYFVVHLNDGQFPKRDGIVVIDDPISSLDANSLYQAFSFLKNAVGDCRQVFVLTHNFDFLKLLLNWRKRAGGGGYYMIKNHFDGDQRRARIVEMDRELAKYESEYHYLFKRLREMQAEQDGTIMRAYPVPNIARKVWDTFLMFRVPNGETEYKKMEQLKKDGFSAQKLDAIYKFTNNQSHITGAGFDPALVPETQKVLGELFEMMKEIAPEHFEILEAATAPQ